MPPTGSKKYVRCRTGFRMPDGRIVKGGEVVRSDDPAVKLCPRDFEPLDGIVEAATRRPGERRLLPRAKKRVVTEVDD